MSLRRSPAVLCVVVALLSILLDQPAGSADARSGWSSAGRGECVAPGSAATGRDVPTPRRGMGLANDAATGQVILFGGYDGVSHFDDTWAWDGASWTPLHPDSAPSGRRSMGMVYDPSREEIVLFGGYDGVNYLNDTWIWDGTNWNPVYPDRAPPPDAVFGMAYEAGTRTIVLFGGEGGNLATWIWDGTTWTPRHPSPAPAWRDLQGMSRDGSGVVMFGGEWAVFESYEILKQTWSWDGTTWTKQRPVFRPRAREAMGMAYDTYHDHVVMFGGLGAVWYDETWIWADGVWTRLRTATTPKGRERMGFAWDSTRRRILMFGGTQGDDCFFGDTWTWDGVDWTEH
jgi:hypothetical protein